MVKETSAIHGKQRLPAVMFKNVMNEIEDTLYV